MKKFTGILLTAIGMLLPLCAVAQDQRSDDRQHHDQDYDNSQAAGTTVYQRRIRAASTIITRAGWNRSAATMRASGPAWKSECAM